MRGSSTHSSGNPQRTGVVVNDFGLGWRVSFQDYRGWRTKDIKEPHPPVHVLNFGLREDAERECRLQRAAGMTACVTPVPLPRATRRVREKLPSGPWPIAHDPKGRPGFGT